MYRKMLTQPTMPEKYRSSLREVYLPSICQLENLLNKSLAAWK
jgi:hypothetical protein